WPSCRSAPRSQLTRHLPRHLRLSPWAASRTLRWVVEEEESKGGRRGCLAEARGEGERHLQGHNLGETATMSVPHDRHQDLKLAIDEFDEELIDPELRFSFQRNSKVCGVDLTDKVVDIIFHVFDANCDGNLSSEEFLRSLQRRENDIRQPATSGFLGCIIMFHLTFIVSVSMTMLILLDNFIVCYCPAAPLTKEPHGKNMNMYFITCFISESGTVEIMLQVNYMICMQIESQMTYNLEWRDYCRLKKHIVCFLDNKTNSLSLKHQFIVELQNIGNPRAYGIGIAKIFIHLLILLILSLPTIYAACLLKNVVLELVVVMRKKLLSVNEVLAISAIFSFLGNYSSYKGNRGTIFTREHFQHWLDYTFFFFG
ncbi:hypothetical protein ACJX0J_030982, partial [Zea mays]